MNTKQKIIVISVALGFSALGQFLFVACGQPLKTELNSGAEKSSIEGEGDDGYLLIGNNNGLDNSYGNNINESNALNSKVFLIGNEQLAMDCSSNLAKFDLYIENAEMNLQACNEYMADVPASSPYYQKVDACDKDSNFVNLSSLGSWSYNASTKVYRFDSSKARDFIRSSVRPGMYRTIVKSPEGKLAASDWVSVKRANKDSCNPTATTSTNNNSGSGQSFTPSPGVQFGGGSSGSATGPVGVVKGILNKVQFASGKYFITGWACQEGVPESITIKVYLNGPEGSGTLLKTTTASVTGEAALGTQCKTTGVSHRFQFSITPTQYSTNLNKKIYVHGIAKKPGSGNNLLGGSGTVKMNVN
ncbi:MAG: hypothetical protein KDD40_06380 [Bdellovibrionales bacterium]|nr:hypothetical protein [Bdellovibrionales bacterium]